MRRIKFLIVFWIVLFLLPLSVGYYLQSSNSPIDFSGYLMFYAFFINPFLFFIPYKLDKIRNHDKKTKIIYICFGLVIPYLLVYTYVVYLFFNMKINFIG
jgi:hypothetical protein